MYRYSTHYSRDEANQALEDYPASGEVFLSQFAEIKMNWQRTINGSVRRYDIMLWDR